MNVRQLSDQLNKLVLDGRGGDSVFVVLLGDDIDERMRDILSRHDWTVTDVDLNDGRSNFVGLDARPA